MGILSEFFFGSGRPKRVTKDEFEKIRGSLYGNLEREEWAEVEMLFQGDLFEDDQHSGIDREEFEQGIAWLRNNMGRHRLEESDIERLETAFTEHLLD